MRSGSDASQNNRDTLLLRESVYTPLLHSFLVKRIRDATKPEHTANWEYVESEFFAIPHVSITLTCPMTDEKACLVKLHEGKLSSLILSANLSFQAMRAMLNKYKVPRASVSRGLDTDVHCVIISALQRSMDVIDRAKSMFTHVLSFLSHEPLQTRLDEVDKWREVARVLLTFQHVAVLFLLGVDWRSKQNAASDIVTLHHPGPFIGVFRSFENIRPRLESLVAEVFVLEASLGATTHRRDRETTSLNETVRLNETTSCETATLTMFDFSPEEWPFQQRFARPLVELASLITKAVIGMRTAERIACTILRDFKRCLFADMHGIDINAADLNDVQDTLVTCCLDVGFVLGNAVTAVIPHCQWTEPSDALPLLMKEMDTLVWYTERLIAKIKQPGQPFVRRYKLL